MDDAELIQAIAGGNHAAFEQVYRAHKDRLLTVTTLLLGGDLAAAEDVLHEVYLRVVETAHVIELRGSLQSYLVSACLNRARDVLRRRRRSTSDNGSFDRLPVESSTPLHVLERAEEVHALLTALAGLAEEQREVVTLHLHGGMTFREIAELHGISINTIQSRYRYALAALRSRLAHDPQLKERKP